MTRTITFATSNAGKLKWLQTIIANHPDLSDLVIEHDETELIEIQSSSVAEISRHKAEQAYSKLNTPVLVYDGGFYIGEWNQFPGPFGKYMIEQLNVEQWSAIIDTLETKSCNFQNCGTFVTAQGETIQFHDTTSDLLTLTSTPWPEDHPKQWSKLWRFLIPSGLGYDKPLAGFSDDELQEYMQKRSAYDAKASCMNDFAKYLLANPHCLG